MRITDKKLSLGINVLSMYIPILYLDDVVKTNIIEAKQRLNYYKIHSNYFESNVMNPYYLELKI